MKAHWTVWLFGIAIILTVGFLLGRWSKSATTVEVSTIDTTMVREFIHDTTVVKDTIYLVDTTIIVDSNTPIGEIPVRSVSVKDSLPIDIQGKRVFLPFYMGIQYRGILYNYTVTTKPRPYKLQTVEDNLDWYAGLNVWIDQAKHLSADVEGGLIFWNRVGLKTRCEIDHEYNVKLKGGLCVLL